MRAGAHKSCLPPSLPPPLPSSLPPFPFSLTARGAQVFACTVGQKPSKAPYYVNDTEDVLFTLQRLAESSIAGSRSGVPSRGPSAALPPRALLT